MTGRARVSWETSQITLYRYMARDLGLKGMELLTLAGARSFARGSGKIGTTESHLGAWWGGERVADSLVSKGLMVKDGERALCGSDLVPYRLTGRAMDPAPGEGAAGWPGIAFGPVTLYGFYVTRLGLVGDDLVAYAVVAEFTHAPAFQSEVSFAEIASWLGDDADAASRALSRLTRRGLLERVPAGLRLGPAARTVWDYVRMGMAAVDAAAAKDTVVGAL